MPFSIASTNEQKVPVTVAPQTASGGPAQVDGALTVTVQSGTATFLQSPATPLEFEAVSGDGAGTTVYLVEADADLGSGTQTISDLVTYEVSGASAVNFGFSAGAAVPK